MKMMAENFRSGSHWITGEVQDTVIDRDGNRTILPVSYNLVVDSCSNLIASLFKNSAITEDVKYDGERIFTSAGIRYWGIGGIPAGESGIDPAEFVDPAGSDNKLKHEFYRALILPENIKFVDKDGKEVGEDAVTNRIKVTIIVPWEDGNGTWYEFGLFGGNSAKPELDTGIMINRKNHDPIVKNVNLQIQRTVIFTF